MVTRLKIPLSKTMSDTPFLASITRPKTHDTVVVTLGIKNVVVGAISGGFFNRRKFTKGCIFMILCLEFRNMSILILHY